MNRKRRIEIMIENRLLVFRRSVHAPLWCTECPAPVQMITPEEAAVLTDASARFTPTSRPVNFILLKRRTANC